MPTHKVKGGYQWGKHGKVYPTKKQADKQGQAIYASGWRENKRNENKNYNMKKQLIRLTESDLNRIIKESIYNILESSNGNIKKQYINKIHKATKDLTSHLYKDESWEAVNNAFEIIEHIIGNNGNLKVWCENGGYWKRAGEFPNYKEYKFNIELLNGVEINGSLKCHSAGTIEDPFDRYDVTINMW